MGTTRVRLAAAVAAFALSLTACSTGPAGGSADQPSGPPAPAASGNFPVTIKHAFGETTIESAPTRVATVSWVNADVSLALGVVPVGMPKDEWGGNERGSTPWKDAALEKAGAAIGTAKAPTQYAETDGINFDELAKLAPEVILASYSGLTKEDYDKLSKIAPVVAYPEVPYGTPWQDSTRMIGKALGREAAADELVRNTEQTIRDKAAKYPQLAGKTFIYGDIDPASAHGIGLYTANDNRPRFLSMLGMTAAPIVAENTKDDAFYIDWSGERANELASDIFLTFVSTPAGADAIKNDPLLGQIPAVRKGALVADSTTPLTYAISAASPLSLPWAVDQFLPQLAAAADKAGA